MKPQQPADSPWKPSRVVRRTILIDGHKTSVKFLRMLSGGELKEIAATRNITLGDLVLTIDNERQHINLSSAIRVFVLDHYRGLCVAPDPSTLQVRP